MDERWCFVINRAVMVMLLVGYVPIQAAVNDAQQGERCTTSSGKAGYCMPKERCNDQEIVDLRTGVPCTDPSLYCCTKVESNAPSWSRKKQYTECDSNKGYCVKSDICSVRTFRLRSNRCPSYDEVCCPKSAFPDEHPELYIASAPSTTTSTVIAASAVAATTTVPTSASSTVDTTTPQLATSSTTTIKQIDSSSTKPPTDPSTDEDCFECVELSSTDKTTTTSTDAVKTIATTTDSIRVSMTSTTEANQEVIAEQTVNQTGLHENDFVENPIDRPPSSIVPPTADTADISSPLLEQFTPEIFTYQTCGQRNPDGVVERKHDQEFRAEYGEFPWTVALLKLPEKRYCCNGALIDKNAIVTTAHCVGNCGNQANQIVVRVGEWNMSATVDAAIPRQDIGVKRQHIHPNYVASSLINNIAVLELKESVQFQATIQPVCLPSPAYTLRSQENMVATGWGATIADGNAAFSNILKRLDLHHVEKSICKDRLQTVQRPYAFQLHQSLVCVDTSHIDQERPCKGDAGSPVVIEIPNTVDTHYLYGLVSWGFGCKQRPNRYTVLTHVGFFRTWIDGILQKPKKNSKTG